MEAAATNATIVTVPTPIHPVEASAGPEIAAPEFLQRHTELKATFTLDDGFSDLAESGADVTVRIGVTPDSRLVARKLADVRRVAYASSAYLAAHGEPRKPEDLAEHACVVRTGVPNPYRWSFKASSGDEVDVTVSGRFESDQVAAVNAAVEGGLGIGSAAFWQIREAVEADRVRIVLPEYEPPPLPLSALWLRTRKMPARTRLPIDFLAARLAGEKL